MNFTDQIFQKVRPRVKKHVNECVTEHSRKHVAGYLKHAAACLKCAAACFKSYPATCFEICGRVL